VKALTNTIYPIVLSFACDTGNYPYSECFAETWIRDDHGATLFWGSSVSSYWTEDDVLEKELVKGWYDHGQERFAQMADYGKYELYLFLGGGGTARRYYEMYNIMGDPSQKVLGATAGGAFSNFGEGISSATYGMPTLTGMGDLTPGGLGFKLFMSSIRPYAPGFLFIGPENSGGIPFKGGYFYPLPVSLSLPLVVGGEGSVLVRGSIPSGFPGNTHFYLQSFFEDDTGPKGATATDGLDLWIY
jgi:hypothetical protein